LAEINEADNAFIGHLCGRGVVKRSMYTLRVVVLSKFVQLLRRIIGIPEQPGAIYDEELLPHQQTVGNNCFCATKPHELGDSDQ